MALPSEESQEREEPGEILCAIYARVSSKKQAREDTIQTQLDDLPAYAERQGWGIHNLYVDDGLSGAYIKDRPEFQRLLADAERGKFNVVLCRDIDRLGRWESDLEWALTCDTFRQNGIRIASDKGKLWDLEDEGDDLLTKLSGFFAKVERRRILDRLIKGRQSKLQKGRFTGGKLPMGYVWDPSTKEIMAEEEGAILVRQIFDMSVKGAGIREIRDRLNAERVPTPSYRVRKLSLERERTGARTRTAKEVSGPPSTEWCTRSILNILGNEMYIGRYRRNLKGVEVDIEIPAIVEASVFHTAQRGLRERRVWKKGEPKYHYLLTGVLYCGLCGRRLMGERNRKYYFYLCKGTRGRYNPDGPKCGLKYFQVHHVDMAVWDRLKAVLLNPDLIREALEREREEKQKLPAIQREITRMDELTNASQEERKAVIRMARTGVITENDLREASLTKLNGRRLSWGRSGRRCWGRPGHWRCQKRRGNEWRRIWPLTRICWRMKAIGR